MHAVNHSESANVVTLRSTGDFQPVVLIVDDDTDCREEYVSTLKDLGYRVVAVADGVEALSMLATNLEIGIVLTDVRMPGMDGVSLLREIGARFGDSRPLTSIVITGFASMSLVVSSMRVDAADFLTKPIDRADIAEALRRASVRWRQMREKAADQKLSVLSENVDRIFGLLKGDSVVSSPLDNQDPDEEQYIVAIRWVMDIRGQRSKYLVSGHFSDPAWDILLDLALARLEGSVVAASSASLAAGIPLSTAMRRVTELVEAGLVTRRNDPEDRRRDIIEISDGAMTQMRAYLRQVLAALDTAKVERSERRSPKV